MSNLIKVSAFIVAIILCNMLLTYRQYKALYAKRIELQKQYKYVSLGQGKKTLIRVLVFVCTDEDLIIKDAYKMSGYSVFERMEKFEAPIGLNIYDVLDGKIPDKIKKRTRLALIDACNYIDLHLQAKEKAENGESNNDDTVLGD